MKLSQFGLRILCLAVPLMAAQLQAQTFDFKYSDFGVDPGFEVSGTINGVIPDDFNYPSGVMNFTDAPGGAVTPNFQAFCVQPHILMDYGTIATYSVAPIGGLNNSNIIASLISAYLSSDQDDLNAAAVQWAIWEITNEESGSYSLNSGNVLIAATDADVAALANQYLATYGEYSPVALTYLTSATGQDIVTWQVIPEPGSVLLIGLSGMAFMARRRRA
ncbi:MAG: PEP-CTERM sorting domain-containing protein [Luteolibacter sp.]